MTKEHILILKGSRIGDSICHTPAINLLRQLKPDAVIDLMTSNQSVAEIFQHFSAIDHVFLLPSDKQLQQINTQYDYALSFEPVNVVEKYLNTLSLPIYIVHDDNHTHICQVMTNFIQKHYYTRSNKISYDYQLHPTTQHEEKIKKLLQKKGINLNQSILIGMHMGCYKVAERASKLFKRNISSHRTWPFKNFKQLANKLYQLDKRIRLVLTGTKAEKPFIEKTFRQDKKAFCVAGETSILELAALMQHLKLFVTGDTGPMHVATAMKTPLIALFGPTRPEITGPFPVQPYHTLISKNHMQDIAVEKVYQVANEKLN